MSENKPLSSVSKDDVVAMAHEDTSLEHIIKMEEVDLKPDYIECYSGGYTEMTYLNVQTGDGNQLISQHNNDESEIEQNEDIKELSEQDTEVKQEIDTNDRIIPLNEHGVPNNFNTAMKMEQTEEGDMDTFVEDNIYLTEVSNKKNNRSNNVIKGKNKHKSKVKSDTKMKLIEKYKTFICNDCSYKSVNRPDFIKHLRTHIGVKPYLCTYCKYRSMYKSNLTQHLRSHTGNKQLFCTNCGYKNTGKAHLASQLRRHDGVKPFSCKFCGYQDSQKARLAQHLNTHTSDKQFPCHICESQYKSTASLKRHLTKHTAEKPSNVEAIKDNTDENDRVEDVMEFYTSDKQFPCHLCESQCKSVSGLKRHLTKHTAEKPSNVEVIKDNTDENDRVEDVMELYTSDKQFPCHICESQYKSVSGLKRHLTKHTAEKPSNVEVIKDNTDENDRVEDVMEYYTSDKQFPCHICESQYKSVSGLKRHLTKHTAEKPSNVEAIKGNTDENDRVEDVMEFYTSDKQFPCHLCESQYKSMASLKRHLTKHTAEKPSNVEVIKDNTDENDRVEDVMELHTSDKQFPCHICESQYKSMASLKIHLTKHTAEKPSNVEAIKDNTDENDRVENDTEIEQNMVSKYKYKNKNTSKVKSSTRNKLNQNAKKYVCDNCAYKSRDRGTFIKHLRTHSGEKPFLSNLVQHLSVHTGEKPYSCTYCDYKCAQKSHLTLHLKRHAGDKPFTCNFCKKTFLKNHYLKRHVQMHTGEKSFSCKFCEYKCWTNDDLKVHIRRHTGEKPFSCTSCQYKSASKTLLNKHSKKHTGEKPYSCSFCEYRCVQKAHLTLHLSIHTGEKPYSCTLCDYSTAHKSHLRLHLRRHNGEKPFSCHLCEYRCIKKSRLAQHLKIHASKQFPCHICEYQSLSKFGLKRHLTKHTAEEASNVDAIKDNTDENDRVEDATEIEQNMVSKYKNKNTSKVKSSTRNKLNQNAKKYVCDNCAYKSSDRGTFIKHLRTHSGEKPFLCNVCQFRCAQKSNLVQHLSLHTGEKPYSCNYCDYKCAQKSHLTLHLRRHDGEKPFSCEFCEYKCIRSSDLKVHLRIHTGEKPFSCKFCEFSTAQKTHLNEHLKIHTCDKPFSCSYCEYKCVRKSHLTSHLRRHAAKKPLVMLKQ